MSREYISLAFVEHAGYNPIAEANNIIVLYPQTHSNALNPLSCFDWYVLGSLKIIKLVGLFLIFALPTVVGGDLHLQLTVSVCMWI